MKSVISIGGTLKWKKKQKKKRYLASFDPANFDVSEISEGNFQS